MTFSWTRFGDFSAEKDDFKFSENLLDVDSHCGHIFHVWEDPNGFNNLDQKSLKNGPKKSQGGRNCASGAKSAGKWVKTKKYI